VHGAADYGASLCITPRIGDLSKFDNAGLAEAAGLVRSSDRIQVKSHPVAAILFEIIDIAGVKGAGSGACIDLDFDPRQAEIR